MIAPTLSDGLDNYVEEISSRHHLSVGICLQRLQFRVGERYLTELTTHSFFQHGVVNPITPNRDLVGSEENS
ncbi:hypothetical protein MITS9509_00144 [Synechococcus sp. MIT S9509]|nr:hypothetical protein MITS9509_00144 [Synechococcus sp. MIT S9509]